MSTEVDGEEKKRKQNDARNGAVFILFAAYLKLCGMMPGTQVGLYGWPIECVYETHKQHYSQSQRSISLVSRGIDRVAPIRGIRLNIARDLYFFLDFRVKTSHSEHRVCTETVEKRIEWQSDAQHALRSYQSRASHTDSSANPG